jgi:uncharacterized membrane protein
MVPIYRILHFLGLSMLLGGTLCSMVLVKKEGATTNSVKLAWNCMHLVAAPGLILLMLTGLLHSSTLYWQHFKNAGYMHAKITLVMILLLLMILDMRTSKKMIKNQSDTAILSNMVKKRQLYAAGVVMVALLIMWLISFRPF